MLTKTKAAIAKGAAELTDIVLKAAAAERSGMKLLTGTELAAIPNTPENRVKAVESVRTLTEQTRSLLQMSAEKRGMYLVWLKTHHAAPKAWQAFCEQNLPDLPQRSIRRWMASYLVATGQKKPRELPAPSEPEDIESDELIDAMMDPAASADEKRPRNELVCENAKLRGQVEKGRKQLADLRDRLQIYREGDCVPARVKDTQSLIAATRVEFYRWLKGWEDGVRRGWGDYDQHRGLFAELEQVMLRAWEERIGPAVEEQMEAEFEESKTAGRVR